MTPAQILAEQRRLVESDGPWTAHDITLADGIHTRDLDSSAYHAQVARVLRIAEDVAVPPLEHCRVLDLGCLEGGYAVAFAQRGAQVVGIEGREANIEKARFARHALGLHRLSFQLDDVRRLSREQYGGFDVVLCLGLLYHLDTPDVFRLVEAMAEVCDGIAIIDTWVAMVPSLEIEYRGRTYDGERRVEDGTAWSSLGNERSFWLERESLDELLLNSGFTSVYEHRAPRPADQLQFRPTLVAVKGVL